MSTNISIFDQSGRYRKNGLIGYICESRMTTPVKSLLSNNVSQVFSDLLLKWAKKDGFIFNARRLNSI
jgi:hypothetical protein